MNTRRMKFVLSRELIAVDSIEAWSMALLRCMIGSAAATRRSSDDGNDPLQSAIDCIYGGSALHGRCRGGLTVMASYEGSAAHDRETSMRRRLAGIERSCLPTIGGCAGSSPQNPWRWFPRRWGLTLPQVSTDPPASMPSAAQVARPGRAPGDGDACEGVDLAARNVTRKVAGKRRGPCRPRRRHRKCGDEFRHLPNEAAILPLRRRRRGLCREHLDRQFTPGGK